MGFFRKIESAGTIRDELAALEKSRSRLSARYEAAVKALDGARADRSAALISDDNDEKSPANAAVERASSDVGALKDALKELESQIAAGRGRLADALEREAREKAASQCEKAADAIEKASLELEQAIDRLAAAFEGMMAAVPEDSGCKFYVPGLGTRPASAIEVARCILAEGLFARCAEVFVIEGREHVGFAVVGSVPLAYRRRDGAFDRMIPKSGEDLKIFASQRCGRRGCD